MPTSLQGELPDEPARAPSVLGLRSPTAHPGRRMHPKCPLRSKGPRTKRAGSLAVRSWSYCLVVLEVPVIILSVDCLTDDV